MAKPRMQQDCGHAEVRWTFTCQNNSWTPDGHFVLPPLAAGSRRSSGTTSPTCGESIDPPSSIQLLNRSRL